MTEYEKRINRAGEEQKDHYNRECIMSGHAEEVLVDAHIFKRSTYPGFAHLRVNRFPLSVDNDRNLEKVVDPWKRICVIMRYVSPEHRQRVMSDINDLVAYVLNVEIHKKGELT